MRGGSLCIDEFVVREACCENVGGLFDVGRRPLVNYDRMLFVGSPVVVSSGRGLFAMLAGQLWAAEVSELRRCGEWDVLDPTGEFRVVGKPRGVGDLNCCGKEEW